MIFTQKFMVQEGQKGALYTDGVFKQALAPGLHRFWRLPWHPEQRHVRLVDVRNRSLTIKGQEILTTDKVAIRVSILVYFCVTDVKAALHNVESYEDRIYEDVQLSTRRFLAVKTLDEILKDRNGISDFVREDVREVAAGYGVEITRADVKDLVFPGNLREIMNRVLETERQSEAMLIEARKKAEAMAVIAQGEREALAARLEGEGALAEQLQKYPVLLRIRELEAYQKIAEKPGQHFYVGLDAQKTPHADS